MRFLTLTSEVIHICYVLYCKSESIVFLSNVCELNLADLYILGERF